jgi:hypothetical protein
VRWLVTTYEVLRRRDLRVAGGIQLTVTASFAHGPALGTATSDAAGHAVLELELPDDLETGTDISVEAISPRGVRRTFDAPITLDARTMVQLVVDREATTPGGSVVAFGRVLGTRDGLPVAGEEVSLSLHERTLVRAPAALVTDASGFFVSEVALPDHAGSFAILAETDDASATASVTTRADAVAPLWVRAETARRVVRPSETVDVDVLVRGEDGVPVAGARVEWADDPPADDEPVIRTGATGHATLRWEIDRLAAPDDGFEDRAREIRVVHAGHGTGSTRAVVRIARPDAFVTWSVEGGALVPGLGGRLFVRVVGPDGAPRSGAAVAIAAGPLGAERTTQTDADGVAAIDVTLGATHDETNGCGGPTAVLAALTVAGAQRDACLPIEPDALLAVHATPHDGSLDVTIARRPDANGRPISVALLARRGEAWEPIARAVIGATAHATRLPLASGLAVPLWVRARPIVDGQEVVGGGTVLFGSTPPDVGALEASGTGASLGGGGAPRSSLVLALDASDAPALDARLTGLGTSLGDAVSRDRTPLFVAALAGALVPRDTSAPAVLREGVVAPLSMPDDAVSQGLLRDPWRTRARFVRGRLGAMMRAVEHLVDARVPDAIDEVGVQENGHWRFDREMLEAALTEAGLGDERAAALDGEPLDIAALTAMDPSFTYDHVARRITRERLFRMLWFLRQLVRERQLDLAWARRGDPREYPLSLLDGSVSFADEYPERAHLFDAWGHPFVLVPLHGAPRFDRLQPVPGFELVSGGPDGRVGNADDVFDPFARVLESGTVYAEAVQEDELVARLGSVELGRATVQTLAEAFSYTPVVDYDVSVASAAISWGSEPSMLPSAPPPLAPIPTVARALFGAASGTADATTITWAPPTEHRAFVAVAMALDALGGLAVRTQPFEAGAPFVARVEAPDTLRTGDALRVPIRFVQLTSGTLDPPRVEARSSSDAARVSVDGDVLVIEAAHPGRAEIAVELHVPGAPTHRLDAPIRVLPVGALHATHAGAIGSGSLSLSLPLPASTEPWRARWVIGAPVALRRDPLFAEGAGHDAALSAWADVLAGSTPSADDLAALESIVSAAPSGLHTACALVAWSSASEGTIDPHFVQASRTLSSTLPAELSSRAAMLAALAPAAPDLGDTSGGVPGVVAMLREDAWRALATERDHPTTLAEMAAALLLVDRDDAIARALFDRARTAAGDAGFALDGTDGLAGNLALIVAARQIDEDALADALAARMLPHLHLALRLGVETRFWALAASGFGALGGDVPARATIEIDGTAREIALDGGIAVLDDVRPGASVRVRSDTRVFVRGEVRSIARYAASGEGAIDVRIEGEVGVLGERAALELVVESTSDEEMAAPVVEIAIPSAAIFDASVRSAITSASAVRAVDGPDGASVLRLSLAPLRARGTLRVPLPLRWRASGHSHGLGLSAYDRSAPWSITTREERLLEVAEPSTTPPSEVP